MASLTLIGRINFNLIGFVLLVALISLFFGLVAVTGNLILVLLITGLLGGLVLVAQPTWLLWLGVVWALVVAGLLTYFAEVRQADWLVYAAALAFWLVAAATSFRAKPADMTRGAGMQGFIVALILFYLIAIVNSLINFDGVVQFMVGIKNYLMFFGLTLALAAGVYSAKTLRQIAIACLVIGLIQVPVTLYQYLVVRAHRISTGGFGYADSIVEASDAVVGTMGGQMMHGGLDDVMTLLNLTLMAGVFMAYRQGMLSLIRTVALSILLLIPVLLAETKVIFIYFPVVAMVVGWDRFKQRPHQLIVALFVLPIVLYAGLLGYYQIHWSKQYSSFEQSVDRLFAYSFEKHISVDRAATGDMSRREAVEFWWETHSLAEPSELLLGHGLAQSKYSSVVVLPRTVREYGMRKLSKTGLSQLLWDTGLIGTVLFIGALVAASRRAARLLRVETLQEMDRVIIKSVEVGLLLVVLNLLYRNSALNVAQAALLLFLMLGLVGYYVRLVSLPIPIRGNSCDH